MNARLCRLSRSALAASVMLVVASVGTGSALAQHSDRSAVLLPRHFTLGFAHAGFILDPRGDPARLRFDGSLEIIALRPQRVKAGIALKRDDGTVLLTIDRHSRLRLITPEAPDGLEAEFDQRAEPLTLARLTREQAVDEAAFAFLKIREEFDVTLLIRLEAPGAPPKAATWSTMADAARVAAIALRDIVAIPLGQRLVTQKLDRVIIRAGRGARVEVADRALVVTIAAARPITGRPSSALLKSTIADLL